MAQEEQERGFGESQGGQTRQLNCLRCETRMKFDTTRSLEGHKDIGLFEWVVGFKQYDIYHCPRCGKVEFFADGIGEDFRESGPSPEAR